MLIGKHMTTNRKHIDVSPRARADWEECLLVAEQQAGRKSIPFLEMERRFGLRRTVEMLVEDPRFQRGFVDMQRHDLLYWTSEALACVTREIGRVH